jgi:hypothetical protein
MIIYVYGKFGPLDEYDGGFRVYTNVNQAMSDYYNYCTDILGEYSQIRIMNSWEYVYPTVLTVSENTLNVKITSKNNILEILPTPKLLPTVHVSETETVWYCKIENCICDEGEEYYVIVGQE